MKTLIIIFGELRTIDACVVSLLDNIIIPNKPCDIILSIDGEYKNIPTSLLSLLNPYIIDIYTTQNKIVERDHHRIEFFLVSEALKRAQDYIDQYTFVAKVRTDIYIKYPLPIKTIYGQCAPLYFRNVFLPFIKQTSINWKDNPDEAIKAWFLTGGQSFFISKQLDEEHPPKSPWCIDNVFDWNSDLFRKIRCICDARRHHDSASQLSVEFIQYIIRELSRDEHIVYLIGSTWIHFGYTDDILRTSIDLCIQYTTLVYPHKREDDILEWHDHKNQIRSKSQQDWKLITDNQIRMIHRTHKFHLFDLVNDADYIESFDASHSHNVNRKDPALFAWLVRPHQVPLQTV